MSKKLQAIAALWVESRGQARAIKAGGGIEGILTTSERRPM